MLKILHLNPTISWRGGEQQTLYLAQYLQKQKQISQIVCGNPHSELEKKCQKLNIPYLPIKIRGEWDFFAVKNLTDYIIKNQIHIVHAHTAKAHSIGLYVKKWSQKYSLSFTLIISRRVDFSIRKYRWKILNSIAKKKYLAKEIDAYIAISHHVKNILIQDGIPKHKIHVIYSGIDLNRFKEKPSLHRLQSLKNALGITKEIILGNVAALVDHKDHKTLLHAISILKQFPKIPTFKLLIIGEGELKSSLLRLTKELNLEDVVFFTGYRQDVFDFYHIFDIFVMSSKEEGLGTSLLDAMAMGLPIVATRGGGIPEVVKHNKGGLLSPIQNPEQLAKNLKILMQSPALRKQFSQWNQSFVKQFHYEYTGRKTLELYYKFLS